jgi:hypothetical protein
MLHHHHHHHSNRYYWFIWDLAAAGKWRSNISFLSISNLHYLVVNLFLHHEKVTKVCYLFKLQCKGSETKPLNVAFLPCTYSIAHKLKSTDYELLAAFA